jgi:succinate dehydrogenase hydrophobic anchor subunit
MQAKGGVLMLSDIFHDIVVTLIVYFLGFLLKTICSPGRDAQPTEKVTVSRKKMSVWFYTLLLVFAVSVHGVFSTSWETPFSLAGLIKSISFLAALFSFVFLQGLFELLLPDEGGAAVPNQASDAETDHGSKK